MWTFYNTRSGTKVHLYPLLLSMHHGLLTEQTYRQVFYQPHATYEDGIKIPACFLQLIWNQEPLRRILTSVMILEVSFCRVHNGEIHRKNRNCEGNFHDENRGFGTNEH